METISLTPAPGLSILTPDQLQLVAILPITQQSPIACCPEHVSSCSCSCLMALNEASSQLHSTEKLNSGWGAPSPLHCEFPICLLTPDATGVKGGFCPPPTLPHALWPLPCPSWTRSSDYILVVLKPIKMTSSPSTSCPLGWGQRLHFSSLPLSGSAG